MRLYDADVGRKRGSVIRLLLKLVVLVVLAAAPVVALSLIWPGAPAVAFYGLLMGSFTWLSGGWRAAVAAVVGLAALAAVVIPLHGQILPLALILVLLGVLYGAAAGRGRAGSVLQLPILVPYLMMSPPGLFSHEAPTISVGYVLGVFSVIGLSGLWIVLLLRTGLGDRAGAQKDVSDPRVPIVHGAALGLISAAVMAISTAEIPHLHWAWITLTIYVLADPNEMVRPKKMASRVGGTVLGFLLVMLLVVVGLPGDVLMACAGLALCALLYCMLTKKPYWLYMIFLTMAVVLADSYRISVLLVDGERVVFTIVGAVLSLLTAYLVNVVVFRRRGIGSGDRPAS